jgi:hypothetical protein
MQRPVHLSNSGVVEQHVGCLIHTVSNRNKGQNPRTEVAKEQWQLAYLGMAELGLIHSLLPDAESLHESSGIPRSYD